LTKRSLTPLIVIAALVWVAALTGCRGIKQPSERAARRQAAELQALYRPGDRPPSLASLGTNSSLADYLTWAMFNAPRVEAAYFDWLATVENITVARSLPDPQLTFQMDIADVVTSVMPGFLQSFPAPGKLRAQANVVAADSHAKYFTFESAVLQTAYGVKQSYYRLWSLEERIRVDRGMLELLSELERIARSQNEAGQGTLADVYRAQMVEDRLSVEIANLEDSRKSVQAQFKGALGLTPAQPDPPVPARFEWTKGDLPPEVVMSEALARNPQLKAMAAEVEQAQMTLNLAYKARLPDASLGLMADPKNAPTLYRPLGTLSLPIWRDKLAAQIAAAQAGKHAAESRLSAAQIELAVMFAEKSFEYREAARNLALLREMLLPKAQQTLEITRSGYLAGRVDFLNLIDAQRALLEYRMLEIGARADREMVLAELSLVVAGLAPANAPVLPPGPPVNINSTPAKP
jgi:cobalt-zinc-cadmium efflux system outer membrane protein